MLEQESSEENNGAPCFSKFALVQSHVDECDVYCVYNFAPVATYIGKKSCVRYRSFGTGSIMCSVSVHKTLRVGLQHEAHNAGFVHYYASSSKEAQYRTVRVREHAAESSLGRRTTSTNHIAQSSNR